MTQKLLHLSIILFIIAACDRYPQDPRHTLERVMNDTIRVGISESGEWASYNERTPAGRDVALVKGFAKPINATIEWVPGNQEHIIELLNQYNVDMAIGGFTNQSPWKKHAGFSHAYNTEKIKVGAAVAVTIPDDADGLEDKSVRVKKRCTALIAVKKKGGKVIAVDILSPAQGLIAAPEQELQALGLEVSEYDLLKEEHVIAIPNGENALLEALD